MDEIEKQWQFMLNHPREEIREIAEAAWREPVLRRFFPYSSMNNLRFSKAVVYPYDKMPYVLTKVPRELYELRDADNRPSMEGALADVVHELARVVALEY